MAGSPKTTFGALNQTIKSELKSLIQDSYFNNTTISDPNLNNYNVQDTDTIETIPKKIENCFNAASHILSNDLTKDNNGSKIYSSNSINARNSLLNNIQKFISQGLRNLQITNELLLADNTPNIQRGGKKSKNNRKNRNQDGGAIPDLVNNVAAFQNMGGLLATASPLDNAQRVEPAIYNAESFNAGIFMPVSSSSGLPDNYKLGMDQPLQPLQGGGKKSKNNKKIKNNKK